MGGHDLVRRMDRQGEVLIWRRKCSGYARQRMEPKIVNCCRPEQVDTKEFGKTGEKNPNSRGRERISSHARRRLLERLAKGR